MVASFMVAAEPCYACSPAVAPGEVVPLTSRAALALPSRSASGALATVVHMVDARFIPAGGVPANKITSPCH
jgi:hypothetical protein